MAGALQPFDRHPASAGALEQAAADLSAQAAKAIDASRLTFSAFLPAIENWHGIAAPELRAAPRPVRERAFEISDSLAWGAAALRYWATQVTRFNDRVEQITADLLAAKTTILSATEPNGDEVALGVKLDAMQAVEEQAKRDWREAYQTHVVGGGRTAAGMLDAGPTSGNVAAAASVGLVPPGLPWNPLSQMWDSFTGNILPPGTYGPLGPWPWLAGRGAAGAGAFSTYLRERYGMRMWHGGLRRRAGALPGPSVSPRAWDLIDRAAKAASRAGNGAGFLGSLSERMRRGANAPSAAAGAAAETGTSVACGRAGAQLGLTYTPPHPLAKAGGAVAGGVIGGVACSPVGRAVGDVVEEGTDNVIDNIVDGFQSLGRPHF